MIMYTQKIMYTCILNYVYMQDNYEYMQDNYVYIITYYFFHTCQNFFIQLKKLCSFHTSASCLTWSVYVLMMMSQWIVLVLTFIWKVISDSLDSDFIHDQSCKKPWYVTHLHNTHICSFTLPLGNYRQHLNIHEQKCIMPCRLFYKQYLFNLTFINRSGCVPIRNHTCYLKSEIHWKGQVLVALVTCTAWGFGFIELWYG